jgi:hypothetical protein
MVGVLKKAIWSFRLRLHSSLRQRGGALCARFLFLGARAVARLKITPASKLAGDPDKPRSA